MQIGVPKETWPGEVRAAMVPANASKLIKQGFSVAVQSGVGLASGFTDADYAEAGASVSDDRSALLAGSDIVMSVRKPDAEDVSSLKAGTLYISFLDPFNEKPLVESIAAQGATAISMEMVPRSTRAQKNGCLVISGQLGRLRDGYSSVLSPTKDHAHDDDPIRHHSAGTGICYWRRCGWIAGHCDSETAGCPG